MAKTLKEVRGKLQLSHLEGQRELLSTDIDLSELVLINPKHAPFPIDEAIIDGTINRTIEGASTVELIVNDRYGILRKSGRLGNAVDIKLDGLWFRLVKPSKTGNNFTLTFESREVAILRTYNKFRASAWGQITRTRFAQILVREVKEFKIPFVCPELHRTPFEKDKAQKAKDRESGYGDWQSAEKRMREKGKPVTIKGREPTREQVRNVETVLDTGYGILQSTRSRDPEPDGRIRRKILVCAIMTGIQEATCYNHPEGDGSSVGFFQQTDGWGSIKDRMNLKKAATKFYTKAIDIDAAQPNLDYGALCQAVQVSAFPRAYSQWRLEAERLVTTYGLAGGDYSGADDTTKANNMGPLSVAAGVDKYQFMRGRPKSKADPSGEKEDSWTCLNRLAEEVNWRCFEVSGSVYFISETKLFKSASRAHLSEESDGVDWIDYDYDVGKKNATVTITGRADRWDAPPGTVITIFDSGVVNGRWLVTEISRNIYSPTATITLKKPRAKLPEPKKSDEQAQGDAGNTKDFQPPDGFDVDADVPRRYPTGGQLRRAVLNNPHITFTRESQKTDIRTGLIKKEVLQFLVAFTGAGFSVTITALRSDHSQRTTRGRVSAHSVGKAVDMGNFTQETQAETRRAMNWIGDHQADLGFEQMIGPIDSLCINGDVHGAGGYDQGTLDQHNTHIHVGYALTRDEAGAAG
jgi:hypothetical protein